MNRGIQIICIVVLCLALIAGCRGTPPQATAQPGTPQASQTLSPPATPVPSAISASTPPTVSAVLPSTSETPAPTVSGASGTIAADQTFSSYSSVQGLYDVQFPDGWSTVAIGANVRFSHGWSGLQVEIGHLNGAFTPAAIQAGPVATLISSGRAVTVRSVEGVTAKGGQAVLVTYECNSEPAGGKQVRIENQRYYFAKNGSLAALTLWAPVGSSNWKVWAQMADTFEWRQAG